MTQNSVLSLVLSYFLDDFNILIKTILKQYDTAMFVFCEVSIESIEVAGGIVDNHH